MEYLNEAGGEALPLPKAFLSEFTKLEKEADELQLPETNQVSAISEALKKARIDPMIEPDEAPMILSIDQAMIASLGDFSCIIGKAKSKKTFLMTLVVGVFLKGVIGIIQAFHAKGKKRVIWFDTEQSRGHVVKAFRRALALSCDAEFYDIEVYDLRPHSCKERLQMINTVLVDLNPDKDIAFCLIDGIRDLVTDILDPEQANNVVSWLMKVTANQELHICTVLHQNKGDNNARGHLGTEIVNKAQTVLSVTKETDSISMVKAEFCRDREFKPFAFTIDDGIGLPRILNDYCGGGFAESGSGRPVPERLTDTKHSELMAKIFEIQTKYNFAELVTQVSVIYKLGVTNAKRAIQHCTNEGIILKIGKEGKNMIYALAPAKEQESISDDHES